MVAVMFLTRIRGPATWMISAEDVGLSAGFFPLVGAAIGAIQWCALWAILVAIDHAKHVTASPIPLPVSVLSILVTAIGVWLTGALHLDGIADMADGFGGGRTREDVLRIMRDHAVGSYGTIALILVLSLKFASTAVLINRGTVLPYLIIAPALGRASTVALAFSLPYARASDGGLGGSVQYTGPWQLVLSTSTAIGFALLAGWKRAAICALVVLLVTIWVARISGRRIGGMTGDILGATSETCEALVLATGAILSL
jgi:adenosylcobinamide-GDP ribazoletransferase